MIKNQELKCCLFIVCQFPPVHAFNFVLVSAKRSEAKRRVGDTPATKRRVGELPITLLYVDSSPY